MKMFFIVIFNWSKR